MKVGDITTVEFLGNEKFAIGKVLAGGMGTVYQLIPLRSGGAFAFGLKTLQQVMTHGDFERECRAWLSVAQHENVAHAYAFGYWMDRPAIAMDWYPKAMADTKPETDPPATPIQVCYPLRGNPRTLRARRSELQARRSHVQVSFKRREITDLLRLYS